MHKTTAAFLFATMFLPVGASDPGEPLDCTDWVILEPGLTCTYFHPSFQLVSQKGSNLVIDNSGAPIQLDYHGCSTRLQRWDPLNGWKTLAFVEDRTGLFNVCQTYDRGSPVLSTMETSETGHLVNDVLWFDAVDGSVIFPFRSFCSLSCQGTGCGGNCPPTYGAFPFTKWRVIKFEGFAKLFDLVQTYNPASASLTFTVPAHPEGLRGADWFDTYYGDLAMVGDWSQAQPLACDYPASSPSRGDYLEVADPLPDPAPGEGRYYVTAVHYQGEARYGRKSSGGVLSGRDPTLLPACVEPN